jgi:hypothetical protein
MLKIREKWQFLLEILKITQNPGEIFRLESDRESGEISWILNSPVHSRRSGVRKYNRLLISSVISVGKNF